MLISSVVRTKGAFVATIGPDATVATLLEGLADHGVGALVVSRDGQHVHGIVSERDVVRHLGEHGGALLAQPVSAIMTTPAHACTPEDTVEEVMHVMTDRRVRHLPVVVDGTLAGIVSIGDIVKAHIDELQGERNQLIDYIRR